MTCNLQQAPVTLGPDERMAVLKQNHYDYEEYTVMETVIMGHKRLYEVMKEKKMPSI